MTAKGLHILQQFSKTRHRRHADALLCFVGSKSYIACSGFLGFLCRFAAFSWNYFSETRSKLCDCLSSFASNTCAVLGNWGTIVALSSMKNKILLPATHPLVRRCFVKHWTMPQGMFFFETKTSNGSIVGLVSHRWQLTGAGRRKVLGSALGSDKSSIWFAVFGFRLYWKQFSILVCFCFVCQQVIEFEYCRTLPVLLQGMHKPCFFQFWWVLPSRQPKNWSTGHILMVVPWPKISYPGEDWQGKRIKFSLLCFLGGKKRLSWSK